MKGLNLSTFKKTAEDDKTATLLHKDGHALVISKHGLRPIHKKQLEALPMHKMADGGEVTPDATPPANVRQQMNSGAVPTDYGPNTEINTPDTAGNYKSVDESQTGNAPDVQKVQEPENVEAAQEPGRSPASVTGSWGETPEETTVSSGGPAAKPPSGRSPSQASGLRDAMGTSLNFPDPYQAEKNAITAGAKAIGVQGAQTAGAIGKVQEQIHNMPSLQDVANKYTQRADEQYKALQDKKIDPQAYWKDHSKITAGLGILFSGLGQAMGSTAPNAAAQAIDLGVQREIDAQKNAQGNALNLWNMNRQAMGDDISTNLAMQNQLYTGVKYSIDQAAAQQSGPIAKARAQGEIARINQGILQRSMLLGLHAVLNNNATTTPGQPGPITEEEHNQALQNASLYAPDMAKDALTKTLPGRGITTTAPTPEDVGALTSLDTLEKTLNKADALAQTGGATFWGTEANQKAEDIATELRTGLGTLWGFKRAPSPEMEKQYSDMAHSPGSWKTGNAREGYKSLQEYVKTERNSIYNKLGFKPFAKNQQAMQWAAQHPNDPRSAAIINSNRFKR